MCLWPANSLKSDCPCCQSTLKIDAEIRAVISHAEPEKKPVIEDLAAEVAKLKGAAGTARGSIPEIVCGGEESGPRAQPQVR